MGHVENDLSDGNALIGHQRPLSYTDLSGTLRSIAAASEKDGDYTLYHAAVSAWQAMYKLGLALLGFCVSWRRPKVPAPGLALVSSLHRVDSYTRSKCHSL